MGKKPRIVFMGTPEFAVENLKKLIANDYNVVGVITAPDKPAGRGKKIRKSAVKIYAETLNIPILQPTNLKSEAFNEQLQTLEPDLQIIVAFRMLPEIVWRLPKLGTFNLHASLLPDYRGAAPINWAIINGETKTGVTTFFIDDKIDTGAIILQKECVIDADDNVFALHDKLIEIGSDLILETIDLITNGSVVTKPQPKVALPKKAPKLNNTNTKIKWSLQAENVHNLVRGLSEYPGAWTLLKISDDEAKKFIIYKSTFQLSEHQYAAGTVIAEKKKMFIATNDGYILPEIVKLQGKKQMDIVSFLNGVRQKELRIE